MFSELNGKTLTKNQLVDWAIEHDIKLSVEEVVERVIAAGAIIVGKNSKKYYRRKDEQLKRALDFTREELLNLCRKNGTGNKGIEQTFKDLNGKARNVKQIQNAIQNWGIREELVAESEGISKEEATEEVVQAEVKAEDPKEASIVSEINKITEAENIEQDAAVPEKTEKVGTTPYPVEDKQPLLRVTNLEGKVFDYHFIDGKIYLNDKINDNFTYIYPEHIDDLIEELQELKNYVK